MKVCVAAKMFAVTTMLCYTLLLLLERRVIAWKFLRTQKNLGDITEMLITLKCCALMACSDVTLL